MLHEKGLEPVGLELVHSKAWVFAFGTNAVSLAKWGISSDQKVEDTDSVNSSDNGVVATKIASSVEDPKSITMVHFVLQLLTSRVTLSYTNVCLVN